MTFYLRKNVFVGVLVEGSGTKIARLWPMDPDPYQNVTNPQHCFTPLSHPYLPKIRLVKEFVSRHIYAVFI
jgi:hypothetical protein